MSSVKKAAMATAVVVAAGCALLVVSSLVRLVAHGVSAREEPTALETSVARAMRRLATPTMTRDMQNPVSLCEEALADARAHFADHCALCHGNDGRGTTPLGQNLYPKAPDMTLADTQGLTDGELFAIITNGIRLTGMPAWGTGSREDDQSTWRLVHLIRNLGAITPLQLEEMKSMNPRSRAQFEQEEIERRWLEGESAKMPSNKGNH